MKRTASARWQGKIKEGKGTLSTQTGLLSSTPYSFRSRFEDGKETNPEELLGASHAGCFTMALSLFLEKAGFAADTLETQATVTLEPSGGGFAISGIHLQLTGAVPGIDAARFKEVAEDAKANCPISAALKVPITLDATLK